MSAKAESLEKYVVLGMTPNNIIVHPRAPLPQAKSILQYLYTAASSHPPLAPASIDKYMLDANGQQGMVQACRHMEHTSEMGLPVKQGAAE